jgi:NitT/TauT family transport system substrate-binding protein
MRSLKFVLGAVGVLLLLLVVAGPARSADPVKIRNAWVAPVSNWASILLEKRDLARHLGKSYVMEPMRYQGTPPMITALANGELEVANLAFSTFALAVQNAGMEDLRIIADEFQDGVRDFHTNEFMVLKESPVKTVKDLKGRVIATNAAGSAVDIVMRAMLRKNGLDDKKDVTWVEVNFPNMRAMLAEKKVDMIPAVLPFSLDPTLRGMSRVLFTQKEAMGQTQMIIWAARSGFLQKNRAAVVDFMEDTLRAVRWYLDPKNHDEAVKIAAKVSKQPPERFKGWLFTRKDYYRDPSMLPNLDAFQANMKLQSDLGLIKAPLDVRKYADLSIVQEAARRLQ